MIVNNSNDERNDNIGKKNQSKVGQGRCRKRKAGTGKKEEKIQKKRRRGSR